MVRDVLPESLVMDELRTAGIRKDILYRVIVTENPEGTPAFFPTFAGKTWEIGDDGRYRLTLEGDGVVAHRESRLPGISLDIIPPGPDASGQCPPPICSVISTCQKTRPSWIASCSTLLPFSSNR